MIEKCASMIEELKNGQTSESLWSFESENNLPIAFESGH